jgi:Tfp pilus assembly PilM family ATPase
MTHGIGIQNLAETQSMVAVVEQAGEKYRLSHLFHIVEASKDKLQEKLSALFQSESLDRYQVCMSHPTNDAILRKVLVPFNEPKQINQIIQYEAEQHIQSRPIEKLVVDYHLLQTTDQKSWLLVAALPIETLQEAISWIESCNIYPFMIELDIMGLFHTAQAIHDFSNKSVILLDIYQEFCNMLVLSCGQIVEARSVRMQVDSNLAEVVTDLRVTTALRNPLFIQEGVRRTEIMALGVKAKLFLKLIKEVRRTLFETQALDAIYLCGSHEVIEFLPPFLEKRLKLNIIPWDITPYFQIAEGIDRKLLPIAHSAIGLALKALQTTKGGFNFRKEQFAAKQSLEIIKKPLLAFLTLLILLFLLGGIQFHILRKERREEYNDLILQAEQVYGRVTSGETLDAIQYWGKIYETKIFLKNRLAESAQSIPQVPDAIPCWAGIAQKIAEVRNQHYFTIERLNISPGEVLLEGRTENDLCFDLLKAQLRKLPWIDHGEDGIRVTHSQLLENPQDPKLTRQYKLLIKVRE